MRATQELEIPKIVRQLKLYGKRMATSLLIGHYKSLFRGHGVEFDGYREYTTGDDASLIDWKASLRSRSLLVKTYVEERRRGILFLIDAGDSMALGSTALLKHEYVANLVATISYAVIETGDAVSAIFFSDGPRKVVPPGTGQRQFHVLAQALVSPESYGGQLDLGTALHFLLANIRSRSTLVFVISDFLGLHGERWKQELKWVAAKADTICLMIRDPRDRTLPDEPLKVYLQDPHSDRKLLVDTGLLAAHYTQYVQQQEQQLKAAITGSYADLLPLRTEEPFILPLIRFFETRHRQWLS